jgi:hypothetical protein
MFVPLTKKYHKNTVFQDCPNGSFPRDGKGRHRALEDAGGISFYSNVGINDIPGQLANIVCNLFQIKKKVIFF